MRDQGGSLARGIVLLRLRALFWEKQGSFARDRGFFCSANSFLAGDRGGLSWWESKGAVRWRAPMCEKLGALLDIDFLYVVEIGLFCERQRDCGWIIVAS